jgi:hypothetical protein
MTAVMMVVAYSGPQLVDGELAREAQAQDDAGNKHQAQVKVELTVLHATNDGKGIDPDVGDMPQLKKPPFSSYDSYKLVSRETLTLDRKKAKDKPLPNTQVLKVTYQGQTPPNDPKGRRFVIEAELQEEGGKKLIRLLGVNAKEGEMFFVAGPSYSGGILVIGLKVTP